MVKGINLADRHRALQATFATLCDVVGERTLALGTDEEAEYSARLTSKRAVEFRAKTRDGEEVIKTEDVVMGGYGCGEPGHYYFRVKEDSFGIRDYTTNKAVELVPSDEAALLDDVQSQVEDIEETVGMLWKAAWNPDLNPALAAELQARAAAVS